NGRWFLTGFISFQYPVINTSNRFHKSVLETFRKNIPGENSTTYDFEVKLTSSRPQLDLNKEQETKNEEEGGPGETEPPKKTAASWKEKCSTFEKYQQWENEEYEKIIHDEAWIEERKEYHRSLDIKMTLKKAHTDFWSTKAGWKNIKSRRGETIDWRATWVNALTMKCNQVWKDKNDCSDEPTYRVLN
ncbi:MAG: hypothetical protein JXB42_11405, partial [Deltaproteobacteria bacterium]|nr:hypothetical protein [Deltaproteobacteria bacterium]